MSNPPTFLNDDGTASMATVLLMAHHAFRRDLARFATTLARGDISGRAQPLREEWQYFRGALHGHHEMEDTRIFPFLKTQEQALGPVIDGLTADHRRIDPLLERGDHAFADLSHTAAAEKVVRELKALLDAHLATEEATVVPFLRQAKDFPAPPSDAEADLYANGFAWTSHGVAPEVLEAVYRMLPAALTSRLPAARAAFEARCLRVWGTARAGSSRTAIPDEA